MVHLESNGHTSWKVMEHLESNGTSVSHNLKGDNRPACRLSFFRNIHFDITAAC